MTKKAQVELAEAWLRTRDIPYWVQDFQLKIGRVNFYPTTGVILLDGELHKRDQIGLGALETVLREEGLLPGSIMPPPPFLPDE
jgi:hypothetical protein